MMKKLDGDLNRKTPCKCFDLECTLNLQFLFRLHGVLEITIPITSCLCSFFMIKTLIPIFLVVNLLFSVNSYVN